MIDPLERVQQIEETRAKEDTFNSHYRYGKTFLVSLLIISMEYILWIVSRMVCQLQGNFSSNNINNFLSLTDNDRKRFL